MSRYKHAISNLTKNRTTIELAFYHDDTAVTTLVPPREWLGRPTIDRANEWGTSAWYTWEAQLVHNPASIKELRGHMGEDWDKTLFLKLRLPDPEDRKKAAWYKNPKTFATRQEADDARKGDQASWHIVSLRINPLIEDAERKVDAVCSFIPGAPGTNSQFLGCDDDAPIVSPAIGRRMKFHSSLLEGTGFYEALTEQSRHLDLDSARTTRDIVDAMEAWEFKQDITSSHLPSGPLLKMEPEYQASLLRGIYEPNRDRFLKYMLDRPLGLGILTAVSFTVCRCYEQAEALTPYHSPLAMAKRQPWLSALSASFRPSVRSMPVHQHTSLSTTSPLESTFLTPAS